MTRSRFTKEKTKTSLQTDLRILGHKLGKAELEDWYGVPEKFEAKKKAHSSMLRRHYGLRVK